MKMLNISDDDLTYGYSKWLLEYAYIVGCDRFSFDMAVRENDYSTAYQNKLLKQLKPYELGLEVAKVAVIHGDKSDIQEQRMWAISHDSLQVILQFMGRHLLDDETAINAGISGWRFYKGDEIHACAVYGFDYFYFLDPPTGLIDILPCSAAIGNVDA